MAGASRRAAARGRAGSRASKQTGEESTVTFVNRTSAAVELFWLDTDGKRQSYGRLRPGEERSQHTFAGHVWLVTGAQGRPLGVKVAEDSDATVDIRDAPASNRTNPESPEIISDGDAAESPAVGQPDRPRRRSTRRGSSPRSPDGRWEAFLKDHNVCVRDDKGEEIALSHDGTAEDDYGPRFYWSPDSQKLLAIRTKHCEERKVYFIESSPRDQVQPKLHSNTYVKPGDPLPMDRPQLFDLQTKKPVPMDHKLYENPWSIGDYRWAADSSRFTFVFNQRGHQVLRLLAVDAATGAVRAIIDEHSPTFIDYSGKFFLNYVDSFQRERLIWMSERERLNHPLPLRRQHAGKVPEEEPDARRVRGLSAASTASTSPSGRYGSAPAASIPSKTPTTSTIAASTLTASGLTVLHRCSDGTHKIDFSPDGKTFPRIRTRHVDMPPVTELLLQRGQRNPVSCF